MPNFRMLMILNPSVISHKFLHDFFRFITRSIVVDTNFEMRIGLIENTFYSSF